MLRVAFPCWCRVLIGLLSLCFAAQESLNSQSSRLNQQILEASNTSYRQLLLKIEWTVWWYIIQPPSQSAQFMFSLLKMMPMQPGPSVLPSCLILFSYSAVLWFYSLVSPQTLVQKMSNQFFVQRTVFSFFFLVLVLLLRKLWSLFGAAPTRSCIKDGCVFACLC